MTVVFVSPSGQRDNLGDSVLRRPYLDHLRTLGPLHVYVGDDSSYISGLGVTPEDTVYASKAGWYRALLARSRSGPVVFAFNAGEIVLNTRYFTNCAWQALAMLLAKLSGGYSVARGISIRPAPLTSLWAFAPLVRGCQSVVWRDAPSSQRIGRGIVEADWAFVLPSEGDSTAVRSTVAVSMRGDRGTPPQLWFDAVTKLAAELDCSIVVVVQVLRDGPLAHEIAGRLGADLVDWTSRSHREQELIVRGTYAKARAVVSDRIHALIIGMTEGAAPVGSAAGSPEKIVRTFASVTDRHIGFSVRDYAKAADLTKAMSRAVVPISVLRREVEQARRGLLRAVGP